MLTSLNMLSFGLFCFFYIIFVFNFVTRVLAFCIYIMCVYIVWKTCFDLLFLTAAIFCMVFPYP